MRVLSRRWVRDIMIFRPGTSDVNDELQSTPFERGRLIELHEALEDLDRVKRDWRVARARLAQAISRTVRLDVPPDRHCGRRNHEKQRDDIPRPHAAYSQRLRLSHHPLALGRLGSRCFL